MNLIFQIVIVAYLFFGVPISMGVLETVIFSKEKKTVSEIVTNGYLIMLAAFWIVAVVLIRQEQSLLVLSKVWLIVGGISFLFAGIVGRKPLRRMVVESVQFAKSGKSILFALIVVSIMVSILFTRPAIEDNTVLIVEAALKTDNMLYSVNPYSGYQTGMLDLNQVWSPLELLYAVGVILTGVDGQVFVYSMLPVVLLIVFFVSVWRMSSTLFEKEKDRIWFACIVPILYWMTVYMKSRTLITGIFLNSWNGLTLLSCIIVPLMFSMMMKIMQQVENGLKNISSKLEICVMVMVATIAAQLTNNKGAFYIMLMLLLFIGVILVKGGYAYGIKTGRFKKCI